MATSDWVHKDEWRRYGDNYLVVVTRHQSGTPDLDAEVNHGQHRWAVYAYIYPEHPRFERFDGPTLFQEAATELILHGYPSLLRYHYSDKTHSITSVQVGADYHHLGDDRFTWYANPDEAGQVFADADALWDQLNHEAKNVPTDPS